MLVYGYGFSININIFIKTGVKTGCSPLLVQVTLYNLKVNDLLVCHDKVICKALHRRDFDFAFALC